MPVAALRSKTTCKLPRRRTTPRRRSKPPSSLAASASTTRTPSLNFPLDFAFRVFQFHYYILKKEVKLRKAPLRNYLVCLFFEGKDQTHRVQYKSHANTRIRELPCLVSAIACPDFRCLQSEASSRHVETPGIFNKYTPKSSAKAWNKTIS